VKEGQFLTEVKHSFNDVGCYAYKIPDMPSGFVTGFRFNPDKPYDMVVGLKGDFAAIEGKLLKKFEAFGMRHIRDCQIKGLDEVVSTGNRAYIFLNIRVSGDKEKRIKRANRLLVWEWENFKERCKDGTIKKKELEAWPHIVGSKKRFDVLGAIEIAHG